jgi:glycosyltransferase involved in cell wall biosynthesis
MRITLFTPTLAAGGAERAVISLAEVFQQAGHDVSIVIWNRTVDEFYNAPRGVSKHYLDLPEDKIFVRWFDIFGNIRRLRAIRKAIRSTRPEVVISFQDGTNELFILSTVGTDYVKLLSSQNDLMKKSHINSRWDMMRRLLYRFADKIVFLDKDQAKRAETMFPGWKCDGIPNPVSKVELEVDEQSSYVIRDLQKHPLNIIAMGRMVPQKGFDLLLKAFAMVVKSVPDCGLVILGEGELREDLVELSKTLKIEDHLMMPGILPKPHSVIAHCDIFAFSSRFEGQGLALVEAMACGTPPVSYDCPSGPGLIIRDRVDGVLVKPEDIPGFAEALVSLLLDDQKRKSMGEKAREVVTRYDPGEICKRWESLVRELRK